MIKKCLYICVLAFTGLSVNAAELAASIGWSGLRTLGLPLTGVIAEVHAGPGSFVPRGAKLVSMDCGQYAARLVHSQALVDGLAPGVERAKKDKELADELFDRTVLSEVEHREAELKYIETRSHYEAAVATRDEHQWLQGNCVLEADKQLIVLQVHARRGEVLNLNNAAAKLITVADRDAMQAVASVSLPLKQSYKIGKKINVEINGKPVNGKITSIRYLPDNTAQLVARFALFDPRLIASKNAKLIIQ